MDTPSRRSIRCRRSPAPWNARSRISSPSPGNNNGSKALPQLSDDELRFLSQIRRYSGSLNDSDRKLVLAMVKKMAMK